MQKKTVALTGASGTMGYQGFLELYGRGEEFQLALLLRDSEKNRKKFRKYREDPRVRIVWGDLTCYEDVLALVTGADYILHVGGGGGAAAVVPHLAETMGAKHKIAKNAPVISTIGVALAMVRDVLERSVINPTDEDIKAIRKEAEERAIRNGAVPESVEVEIEIDRAKNIVRATAIGATELRSKNLTRSALSVDELRAIVAEDIGTTTENVSAVTDNGQFYVMQSIIEKKSFFGLLKKKTQVLRLIDDEGVIRLKRKSANVYEANHENWEESLRKIAEINTTLNDGGAQLPYIFVIYGKRIISLANLATVDNMIALAQVELANVGPDDKLLVICTTEIN